MRFSQVDVFTDELLYGNPVAVVHDADGVSDTDMAAFARWTNLSETTFLLTPTDPVADYRLRIFTTHGELPFAGHPTLGSAQAWLAAGGVPRQDGQLVQECGAGLVRVREDGGRLAFAAPPLLRSGPVDETEVAHLAEGLGLSRSDVVDAQWGDNGPGWVILLLGSADAVLAVDPSALADDAKVGIAGPYPGGSPADIEVRAFFPGGEDPVTGSLNASIAQWLIGTGRLPDAYTSSQGTRLGRRGRVHVASIDDDIWVGGDTVVGITGTVDL
ncbi:MAG: PhzF family phenazine biosynthesis protein [Aeromicrobium sp.]